MANPNTPLRAGPAIAPEAVQWADLLRQGFSAMHSDDALIDTTCFKAPRRKHADPQSAGLAVEVAGLLYPAPAESTFSQVMKYEKDIVQLRKAITDQKRAKETETANEHDTWRRRILEQGPWDEAVDAWSLDGTPALPMPVTISDSDSLIDIFTHLSGGGSIAPSANVSTFGKEPYYGSETLEFQKGIVYEDGRLDLCKKVLGPPNINQLMKSLETNNFVRHFLLGNNVIGPVGARAIADFVRKYPDRMETWYLAGNCIDSAGFDHLASAWTKSTTITNLWLKRNPLGPKSVLDLVNLITKLPNLRTLDLDQTELSNEGVALLFNSFAPDNNGVHPLRNIYLNAVGISEKACKAIAHYLSQSGCALESLYMSNNPIGDGGAMALAKGLKTNKSLLRLSMSSCGLKGKGAADIFEALAGHPRIMTLDCAQSYATLDLGSRYNFIDDEAVETLTTLLIQSRTLHLLSLGLTPLSPASLSLLTEAALTSPSLLVCTIDSLHHHCHPHPSLRASLRAHLAENIHRLHNGMDADTFHAEEERWLVSPRDVRFIDSGYRNRDAGLARRGLVRLEKWWGVGDGTVEGVMAAGGGGKRGF